MKVSLLCKRNKNDEQGTILFFILALIVVISGVVNYYFIPYRMMAGDFMISTVRNEVVMQSYGIEKTLSRIVPRIDVNIYKVLHKIPLGSPVIIKKNIKNKTIKIQVVSMNNCINISSLREGKYTEQNSRLYAVLDKLSEYLLGERNQAQKLAAVLKMPESQDHRMSSILRNKRFLSVEQRALRARIAPFVCQRADTGQRININAIGPDQFPVLLSILPDGITENTLMKIWIKQGSKPWESTEDFFQALSPSVPVTSSVKNELIVTDEEIQVTISYENNRGDDFYMSDIFLLENNAMRLFSRHLYRDDDIR